MRAKWIALLMIGALALLLVGCSGDGSTTATDESAVAAADHDADGHDDEAATDADHDADGHDDEAAMAAGNEDEDANAYLEIAAKDTLYLVQMSSFAFTPSVLEAKVGEVVEIAIQNVDPILHDFTIEKIDADLHISYLGGSGEHAHDATTMEMEAPDLHFALTEAGSGVVHIKVHEPGVYIFYCSVPGHRELGMEGVLRIN